MFRSIYVIGFILGSISGVSHARTWTVEVLFPNGETRITPIPLVSGSGTKTIDLPDAPWECGVSITYLHDIQNSFEIADIKCSNKVDIASHFMVPIALDCNVKGTLPRTSEVTLGGLRMDKSGIGIDKKDPRSITYNVTVRCK